MTDANCNSAQWQYDHFGRLMSHTDIGGAVCGYQYAAAGQRISERVTQNGVLYWHH